MSEIDKSNSNKFFIKESSNDYISPSSIVKYYEYKDNPVIEATVMSYKPRGNNNNWIKLNKNQFRNKITGEVRTYESKNHSNRNDNIQNIKRSQQRLVHLIRNNFSNPKQLKFHIVLTFAEPVYDYDVAVDYWKVFRNRLKARFPNIQFIAIFEYYTKGKYKNSIHIHLLLLPFYNHINREIIKHYWNFGYVHFKDFNSNTATYFVKSDTLHLYPKGKRLYTKTKLITMPVVKEMSIKKFEKKVKDYDCTSRKGIDLMAIDNGIEKCVNRITYFNYIKKDKKEM